jgi:hypothetical protein
MPRGPKGEKRSADVTRLRTMAYHHEGAERPPLDGPGWQSRRGWGGSLGEERPSAANVARPNSYALQRGDAACDGWGWPKGGIEAWLFQCFGSIRGCRLKARKGMTGGRSWEGREVRGGRTGHAPAIWHSAVFGRRPGRRSYF